jgi:hypothetical protein
MSQDIVEFVQKCHICQLLGCFDCIAKGNIDPRLLSWMAALGTQTYVVSLVE